MLYLIGLGFCLDITCKGYNIAKRCDEVFLDAYTTPLENVEKIVEKKLNIKIKPLKREEIESNKLIELAKSKDIAVLVVGNPLFATTHIDLKERCAENNVEIQIIHNTSVFDSVSELGLNMYKFGRTVTITHWTETFKSKTPIEFIEKNLMIGLHTLALFDVNPPMNGNEALKTLVEMQQSKHVNIVKEMIIVERAGLSDQRILYGKVEKLMEFNLKKFPAYAVIPGKLDEFEKKRINKYKI